MAKGQKRVKNTHNFLFQSLHGRLVSLSLHLEVISRLVLSGQVALELILLLLLIFKSLN
jgi:hypothetical protein